MLTNTEASLAEMRRSLLRIAGGIQMLEELLGQEEAAPTNGETPTLGAQSKVAGAALDEKPA